MKLALTLLLALLLGFASSADAMKLYSIAGDDDQLREVSPATGATVTNVAITLAGKTVVKGHGLALDPTTTMLWGILQTLEDGNAGRILVTLNPATGVATPVGSLSDLFVGLAFTSAGTLYGVTGDGATNPNALATLSTLDGTAAFVLSPTNGFGAQNIAFHSDNGLMYHMSGADVFKNYESINLISLTATPIALSGSGYTLARAMTYEGGSNFLVAVFASGGPSKPGLAAVPTDHYLYRVGDGGASAVIGVMDHISRGLAAQDLPIPVETTTWGRIKSGQ